MEERRKSPRHRVYKAGAIAFDRTSAMRCILRNISATGACLQFDNPFGIPQSCDLLITATTPRTIAMSCGAQGIAWAWPSASPLRVWSTEY
jgi:hypothetical protein